MPFGNSINRQIGAVGTNSLAATTQTEGRIAIAAAPSVFNPTLVSAFPGTVTNGTIIQTPDGGIWRGNYGEWRLRGVSADPLTLINANRGLIYNGGCTIPPRADVGGVLRVPGWGHAGDAIPTFETPVQAWPNDARYGLYSLRTTSPNHLVNDYAFPVEAGAIYGYYVSLKVDMTTTNKWYASIHCLDEDGAYIRVRHFNWISGTQSYLSRALNNGDTTAYVHLYRDSPTNTDLVTNWSGAGEDSSLRYLGVYNDVSTGGLNYPSWVNATTASPAFTRRIRIYNAISTVGNEIVLTLSSAWNFGNAPAGTAVANNFDGGTYLYPWSNRSYPAANQWTDYVPTTATSNSGAFGVGGTGNVTPLRPYTRTVLAGVLLNYYLSQNTTTLFHAQIYRIG